MNKFECILGEVDFIELEKIRIDDDIKSHSAIRDGSVNLTLSITDNMSGALDYMRRQFERHRDRENFERHRLEQERRQVMEFEFGMRTVRPEYVMRMIDR